MGTIIVQTFTAALIGIVAWSGYKMLLPVSLLLFPLWSIAKRRRDAYFIGIFYYLGATWTLPAAAALYLESILGALTIWIGCAHLLAVPFGLFWSQENSRKSFFSLLIIAAVALPPLGVLGVTNPITAAGVLFPHTSFIGLSATLMLCFFITRCPRFYPVVFIPLLLQIPFADARSSHQIEQPRWREVSTKFYDDLSSATSYERQMTLLRAVHEVAITEAEVIVLPESVAGLWGKTTSSLWLDSFPDGARTVLVGASTLEKDGLHNVVVSVSGKTTEVIYRQRQPVPFSMWQPWDENAYRAHWFSNPVVDVAGIRAMFLICYEEFLVWPVLHSMLYQPEVVISLSNNWWSNHTRLPDVQQSATAAWGDLFGVRIVSATNT